MRRVFCCGLAVAGIAAVAACGMAPKADVKAEEATLRGLDTLFGAAVARKDVAAGVALYAADAVILAPEAPASKGTDAIRAVWMGLLKLQGVTLKIMPEQVDIAASGDMATDMGRVEMEFDTPQGRVKDVEKYLEVWKKVDGEWKVMYDMWNSNAPPSPAPAPAAKKM